MCKRNRSETLLSDCIDIYIISVILLLDCIIVYYIVDILQ